MVSSHTNPSSSTDTRTGTLSRRDSYETRHAHHGKKDVKQWMRNIRQAWQHKKRTVMNRIPAVHHSSLRHHSHGTSTPLDDICLPSEYRNNPPRHVHHKNEESSSQFNSDPDPEHLPQSGSPPIRCRRHLRHDSRTLSLNSLDLSHITASTRKQCVHHSCSNKNNNHNNNIHLPLFNKKKSNKENVSAQLKHIISGQDRPSPVSSTIRASPSFTSSSSSSSSSISIITHSDDSLSPEELWWRAIDQGNTVEVEHLLPTNTATASSSSSASLSLSSFPSSPTVSSVNIRHQRNGATALHIASTKDRNIPLLRILLHAGAHINATDNIGGTPLHWASSRGQARVVEFLISTGATINRRDHYGYSPLHIGLRRHHFTITDTMLLFRGDINFAQGVSGGTALHVACERGDLRLIRYLLRHDALVNARDNRGDTPLLRAVTLHHAKTVQLLFHDTPVSQHRNMLLVHSHTGENPLHRAARVGHAAVVPVLRKVDPSLFQEHLINDVHPTASLGTPLHVAVSNGHARVVKRLLKCGADPNRTDTKGDIPLHLVCRVLSSDKNHPNSNNNNTSNTVYQDMAAMLLHCGADWSLKNDRKEKCKKTIHDLHLQCFAHMSPPSRTSPRSPTGTLPSSAASSLHSETLGFSIGQDHHNYNGHGNN